MRVRRAILSVLVAGVVAGGSFDRDARAAEPFEKVYCLQYATLANYPMDRLLWNAPRDETVDAPFAMCAAVRGKEVVLLDSGYVNQEVGTVLNETVSAEIPAIEIGTGHHKNLPSQFKAQFGRDQGPAPHRRFDDDNGLNQRGDNSIPLRETKGRPQGLGK